MEERKISKTTANWLICLEQFYSLQESVSKAITEQYGEGTNDANIQKQEFARDLGETLAGLENELAKSIGGKLQEADNKTEI